MNRGPAPQILFSGDLQNFWDNNSYEAAPLESGDKGRSVNGSIWVL